MGLMRPVDMGLMRPVDHGSDETKDCSINKMNDYIKSLNTKKMTFLNRNPDPDLGQTQKRGGVI
jgi:hypothetical protein